MGVLKCEWATTFDEALESDIDGQWDAGRGAAVAPEGEALADCFTTVHRDWKVDSLVVWLGDHQRVVKSTKTETIHETAWSAPRDWLRSGITTVIDCLRPHCTTTTTTATTTTTMRLGVDAINADRSACWNLASQPLRYLTLDSGEYGYPNSSEDCSIVNF